MWAAKGRMSSQSTLCIWTGPMTLTASFVSLRMRALRSLSSAWTRTANLGSIAPTCRTLRIGSQHVVQMSTVGAGCGSSVGTRMRDSIRMWRIMSRSNAAIAMFSEERGAVTKAAMIETQVTGTQALSWGSCSRRHKASKARAAPASQISGRNGGEVWTSGFEALLVPAILRSSKMGFQERGGTAVRTVAWELTRRSMLAPR
mmetsp:Transcript_13233/g.38456  ORF Transcript_13233/g.38456 Transcript_13233/m.38456 type:complete len:202 (+) Transcript_13233:1085-1690(+)